MITQETLTAVRRGILDDGQLKEAITHYKKLEKLLYCHRAEQRLFWLETREILERLLYYDKLRREEKK
jgi:hypothetical protein